MSGRTRALLIVVVVLALAGAWLAYEWSGSVIVDEPEQERLTSHAIAAIIVGTVQDVRDPPSRWGNHHQLRIKVREVAYWRGPHWRLSHDRPVEHDKILVGQDLDVVYFQDPPPPAGSEYVFTLGRVYRDDPAVQAHWQWQSFLAIDQASGLPVDGTPPPVVDDLARITRPEESSVDALIAFAEEQAIRLAARLQGMPEPPLGERERLLEPTPEPDNRLEVFASTSPERRQLPDILADLPEGAADAIGLDGWHPWRVIVRYDAGVADTHGFVGLWFDGVGFLGPVHLNPSAAFVEIVGYGPANAEPAILLWPEIEDGQMPDAAERQVRTVAWPSGADRSIVDEGGALDVQLSERGATGTSRTNDEVADFVRDNEQPHVRDPEEVTTDS